MRPREIIIAIASILLAIGGAAMFQMAPALWQKHEQAIFALAATLVAIGFAGFAWAIRHKREEAPSAPPLTSSTTAKAVRGGKIFLEDSYSAADTLAHAEEGASVTARRTVQDPSRSAGRTSLGTGNGRKARGLDDSDTSEKLR